MDFSANIEYGMGDSDSEELTGRTASEESEEKLLQNALVVHKLAKRVFQFA